MSKGSVNKSILVGRLGKDPEVRAVNDETNVCNFSIATNRSVKRGDQWEDETDWHNVVAWRRLCDLMQKYTSKGSRVYVEGRMQTRSWEDTDGNKRYITEVVASDIQLLDSKADTPEPASAPAAAATPDGVPF